jgi:hypothetical protein
MQKETTMDTDSPEMWQKLEDSLGEVPVPTDVVAPRLTSEQMSRLSRRGLVYGTSVAVPGGSTDVIEIMPGSPADRLSTLLDSDATMSPMKKAETLVRFMYDATNEVEDDNFRANWPELF